MNRLFLSLALCVAAVAWFNSARCEFTGSEVHGTAPGNLRVGGKYNFQVDYRFRAEQTAYLQSFKVYWIGKSSPSGYSGGNGGKYRITLHADDGTSAHLPRSASLATAYYDPDYSSLDNKYVDFGKISLSSTPRLEKGSLYHLRFVNVDSYPRSNYLSLNALYMPDNGDTNRPTISATDLSTLVYYPDGKRWTERPNFLPILTLHSKKNQDGTGDVYQGQGYMDATDATDNSLTKITGSKRLRQTITPPYDVTFYGIGLAIGRYSGTGRLNIAVKTASGKILGRTSIPAGSAPSATCSIGTGGKCHKWVQAEFSAPITLKGASSYYIELYTASDTLYRVNVLQEGSSALYNLPTQSTFSWGLLEYSADSGSTYERWRNSYSYNRSDFDLPFYLDLAESPQISALYLTDPETGRRLVDLTKSTEINLQSLAVSNVEVEALTEGNTKSVRFDLNGRFYSKEEFAPWELNGGNPWRFSDGQHTVTAWAFSGDNFQGSSSQPFSVSFFISKTDLDLPLYSGGSDAPRITALYLTDAFTGSRLVDLTKTSEIDLGALGTSNVEVEALTEGTTKSVRFDLNGRFYSKEEFAPWELNGGNPWRFSSGQQTVTAWAFSGDDFQGSSSQPFSVSFSIR